MEEENVVLKQLRERTSVRAFAQRPVPQEVKDAVIGAAFEAPTAGDMMFYTIIDVTDQAVKEQLAVFCDHQPFIAKAPLVLTFVADCDRWYRTYQAAGLTVRQPGPGDLVLACADAVIAAQNTVVAAQALGLGSCYIGDILENCDAVRQLLGLPEFAMPAVLVVYGYPTQQQRDRPKPARFARSHIVHENTYRPMDADELLGMYAERGDRESIDALCKRKYLSAFSLEMNRSVAQYLERFRGS
jgi:nitroreductase